MFCNCIYQAVILTNFITWASNSEVKKLDIAKESINAIAANNQLKVISFNPEQTQYKATYQGTSSWARLVNEVWLSEFYTICSDITWHKVYNLGSVFFTLLGQNRRHFLSSGVASEKTRGVPYFILKDQTMEETHVKNPPKNQMNWYIAAWLSQLMLVLFICDG